MIAGRVLILADYGDGGGGQSGGAGAVVSDGWRALRAAGIAADLATGFGEAAPGARSLDGEDLRAAGSAGWRTIWNAPARDGVAELLRGYDPASTVVMLHQWTRWLSPASLVSLRDFALMVTCHDYFWACPNGAYFDFPAGAPCDRRPLGLRCVTRQCDRAGAAAKAGRVARQLALRHAQGPPGTRRVLLQLSERARRLMLDLAPRERHEILHNPLPAAPPVSRHAAPAAVYDIGYFGRLEPEKGVIALARAAAAQGLSALFVGEGSCAAQLGAHAGATVRPWLDRAHVPAMMRSCGAIALPSLWPETWGLTIAEAMAAGVPVLVSARAGSAELVERFGGGRVFDPGHAGDLSTKLRMLRAAPRCVERPAALRDMLSPERYAARVAGLARWHFGIELAGGVIPRRAAPPAARPNVVRLPAR